MLSDQIDFIILDDGSSDGTRAALENLSRDLSGKMDRIYCLSGDGNSFYTGGMRQAMEAALLRLSNDSESYDYILLFNDDVAFEKEKVMHFLELAERHPGSVWVGPTCDDQGELTYGGVQRTSNWRPKYRIVKSENETGNYEKCYTFNANCVLIPADIFLQIGNMDPVYRHSLGDFDYGFMISKAGFDIYVSDEYVGICCDNSKAGTYNDRSLSIRERIRKKESAKGVPAREWWHYLRKNYGLVSACIYSVTPYIRIILGR